MQRVKVALDPAYDVLVGAGVLDAVSDALDARSGRTVAVVAQDAVLDLFGAQVVAPLEASGRRVVTTVIGDGEEAKCFGTVEDLCRRWVTDGLLRADTVVALGGGVVGDTAGFAAAVYHRGIAVVQCPTTLLAQVDAAIGGKTAVNLPEGKNLVGAFHQPIAVLADVTTLATLPEREYRSGLGEVAKYALMGGVDGAAAVAAVLADEREAIRARDPEVLTDLVARCAAIKAHVVATDPQEHTGLRATLNYGHTLGHALETVGHHDLHHGEAVAVGLVFAGTLAAAMERIPASEADRHRTLVAGLGLPTEAPGLAAPELLAVMRRDKKAHGGVTFVLDGPGGLESVDDPPETALAAAFHAVGIET